MAKAAKFVSEEEFFSQMGRWLAGLKRPAWEPVVEDGEDGLIDSKFCGTPWLTADESWPVCGNCDNPMHLLLQLNLAELPEELGDRHGKGLFQFFCCTQEDCVINAYGDPFSSSYLPRVVQPDGNEESPEIPEFNESYPDPFPAMKITDWNPIDDFPSITEFASLGIAHEPFQRDKQTWLRVEHAPLGIRSEMPYDEFKKLDRCAPGDKLAGWPDWANINVEYPNCPDCGKPMQTILFTLESGVNIPFEFGDGGRGHIAQCSTHKHRFGFAWQSG